ncbi:hypothetical protein IL252_12275 [Halomicrobium sp. IBSBa]|uniref:hypothetical protein n=1 Tax=Halomicrobium sp. IBSBa TaxID=2778916 RepID=UPI001ABF6BB8|nr:hypothetical protein [Halomicrobium sp. IBSBa]MBO4248591.1 hypothetical protein [Halomicrobium sp. IBSBa]
MSRRDSFPRFLLKYVCSQKRGIAALFGFLAVALVLLAVSVSVTEPGSANHVLAVLNLIGIGLLEGLLVVLVLACWSITGDDPVE